MDRLDVTVSNPNVRAGESLYASSFTYQGYPTADTPTLLEYRVDDLTDGTVEVRAWTVAIPSSSTSVILTGVDVAMLHSSDLKETRQVTFRATKSTTVLTTTGTYLVTNLGYQSIIVSLACVLAPTLERYSPMPSQRISRCVDLDNRNP